MLLKNLYFFLNKKNRTINVFDEERKTKKTRGESSIYTSPTLNVGAVVHVTLRSSNQINNDNNQKS